MTSDLPELVDHLERQLLEAAARTAGRRRRRSLAVTGSALGAVALVLLIVGGRLLLSGGGTSSPERHAARPTPRHHVGPQPLVASAGTTGPPATFPTQRVALCPTALAPTGATGNVRLSGSALALHVTGLPAANTYLIWFLRSPKDAQPIGFARYDTRKRALDGGVAGLPRAALAYHHIIITNETGPTVSTPPRRVVMRSGAIAPSPDSPRC